jgi:hypothetical protein
MSVVVWQTARFEIDRPFSALEFFLSAPRGVQKIGEAQSPEKALSTRKRD